MRSVIVAAVLATGLAGCASSAPAPSEVLVPIAGWSRPLCSDTAVAVTSPWDGEVQEVFTELLAAADPEVQRRAPLAVVVHGDGLHLASICGTSSRVTVLISTRLLRVASTWPTEQRRSMLAATVAHELAHIALHENAADVPRDVKETEAEALGVYYFERAGLDCRRWVAGLGTWFRAGSSPQHRATIRDACEAAKRGERPPLPPR
jgi:hypothetical protein